MTLWLFLLLIATGVFLGTYARKRKDLLHSFTMGFFLAGFDLLVENAGYLLNLWQASNSLFFLGAVPVEVFGIAFFAGATYFLVLEDHKGFRTLAASTIFLAAGGASIEYILVSQGLLVYISPWNPFLAFLAYLVTFTMMFLLKNWYSRFTPSRLRQHLS